MTMERDFIPDYLWTMPKGTPRDERKAKHTGDIFINGAVCLKCGEFIRSRNVHDYRPCSCGAVAVDGGSWYVRRRGDREDYVDVIELYADAKTTEEELIDTGITDTPGGASMGTDLNLGPH